MKAADIPAKFNIPFADAAGAGFVRSIPQPPQPGGAASLTQGFPPENFLPIGAGGIPPDGQDMNGILKQISAWSRWQNAGGVVSYDAVFSAAISGYPAGAVLKATSAPFFWLSTADDNATNPDTGGAGWTALGAFGPARVITAIGAFVLLAGDVSVGLARGSAGASSTSLFNAPSNGRVLYIEDLTGSFDTSPVTVSPTGGATIAGLPSWTLNVRRQCARFKYYSTGNVWSVKI